MCCHLLSQTMLMIIIKVHRQGSPWCLPAAISAHLDESLRQDCFNMFTLYFFKEVRRHAAAGRVAESITSVCDLLGKDFNTFSPPTIFVAPVCPGTSAPITLTSPSLLWCIIE